MYYTLDTIVVINFYITTTRATEHVSQSDYEHGHENNTLSCLCCRYGFRTNPKLWLSAKPKVGSREVSVSHITDWIEKKLTIEFQVN